LQDVNSVSFKNLLAAAFLLAGVAFTAWFAFAIARVFLLIFASIVIAIFLRGCGCWLAPRLKVAPAAGVAITVLGFLALFGLAGWFLAPRVEAQFAELQVTLPHSIQQLTESAGQPQWRRMIGTAASGLFAELHPFQSVSRWLVDAVVLAFMSLYLAFQPSVYRRGLLRLFPARIRPETAAVFDRVRHTLWRWFIGRIIGMIVIGVLVLVANSAIGMPLAFTLGLIAAVFEFVPYAGAIVSSIPAILLALSLGPTMVWWVAGLYLVVHGIDGYIVLPLVERRAIRIPPALTITVQFAMFSVAGLLGVLVADPLAALALVLFETFQDQDRSPDAA
jgi:predicted PurR-regulated permease PerM